MEARLLGQDLHLLLIPPAEGMLSTMSVASARRKEMLRCFPASLPIPSSGA